MPQTKILVAYATKAGSTGEIAQKIAQILRQSGAQVDVRLVKNIANLNSYNSLVIGSAIRAGAWLPHVVEFVENNQATLKQMSVAYFAVCLTLQEDTPENRQTVRAYLDPVCDLVTPLDVGLFAGQLDYQRLNLVESLMLKMMKAPAGDYRDWSAIETWAKTLADKLITNPELS